MTTVVGVFSLCNWIIKDEGKMKKEVWKQTNLKRKIANSCKLCTKSEQVIVDYLLHELLIKLHHDIEFSVLFIGHAILLNLVPRLNTYFCQNSLPEQILNARHLFVR